MLSKAMKSLPDTAQCAFEMRCANLVPEAEQVLGLTGDLCPLSPSRLSENRGRRELPER